MALWNPSPASAVGPARWVQPWLAVIVVLFSTHALAVAVDCSGPNPLAIADLGPPAVTPIQKIQLFDFVIFEHLATLRSRDATDLGSRDNSPSIGATASTSLVWNTGSDAFVYVAREDAAVRPIKVFSNGQWGVLEWPAWLPLGRPGCTDDTIAHPLLVQRRETASDSFRSAFVNDIIYVGTAYAPGGMSYCAATSGNRIYAVDATDGSIEWTFNGSEGHLMDAVYGLAIDPIDDVLYATSERRHSTTQYSTWAIDAVNGFVEWRVSAGRIRTAPVLRGDRLYVATLGGDLTALNRADGSVIWSLTTGGIPIVTAIVAPLVPPYHDAIILQDYLGRVHLARDEGSTGRWDWMTPIPLVNGSTLAASAPAVDPVAGVVYAPDDNGTIHQLDALTGVAETTITLEGVPSWATSFLLDWPFLDGEPVEMLAGSSEGSVARFCIENGGMLRDSIGPDAWRTTATWQGKASYEDTDSGDAAVVVHTIDVEGPTLLTRFEAVAGGVGPCDVGRGPTPCLEQMEFFLMGWPVDVSIEGDVADAAAPGKLFHVSVTDRVTIVRGFGSVRYDGGDLVETALLGFDLSGLELQCPSAGCRVALMGRGSAFQLGELSIPYIPYFAGADAWHRFPATPDSTSILKVGVRVRGEPQATTAVFPDRVTASRLHLDISPNPFNPRTVLSFVGEEGSTVEVDIFDVAGRKVASLYDGRATGMKQRIVWEGSQQASGVYFVRIASQGQELAQKITLLK